MIIAPAPQVYPYSKNTTWILILVALLAVELVFFMYAMVMKARL